MIDLGKGEASGMKFMELTTFLLVTLCNMHDFDSLIEFYQSGTFCGNVPR